MNEKYFLINTKEGNVKEFETAHSLLSSVQKQILVPAHLKNLRVIQGKTLFLTFKLDLEWEQPTK